MEVESPFDSFFMGGFECSTHRRRDGRRLDLIAATRHDELAEADYRRLAEIGLTTVRDGLRWHLIETSSGRYDWSSALPMIRAAHRAGVQVIWDLCHYGWPDDIDIWSADFVDRFARFAGAAARLMRDESDAVPFYCPVNEISYWAWAGGEVARMNPATRHRGSELKRQLARAAVAATEAARAVDSRARFIYAEPGVHVTTHSRRRKDRAAAEAYRLAQFEACDVVSGKLDPELGGRPDCLDIVGINFYPDNQWLFNGRTIHFGHHAYRPFRELLAETHARYGRPVMVTETGAEGGTRASWLHYMCGEVRAALAAGVPVLGICLYPILDYPGWENARCCEVGLFSGPDASGNRRVCEALLHELAHQQRLMEAARASQPSLDATAGELSLVAGND
jgi:beta-glucosidase/6-phospho-beta-glucosidase/beta-galactosidase